jgi:hypothetical protein
MTGEGIYGLVTRSARAAATGLCLFALALPASSTPASAATPSVCYEVENGNNAWLDDDAGCDGEKVAPSGGINGFSAHSEGLGNVNLIYNAYSGGTWVGPVEESRKISPGAPITAFQIELSYRGNRHIKYKAWSTDAAGVETRFEGQDNGVVGNKADKLTKLVITIN